MKKKIISLCLVIALVATAIAGATLAYFTDTTEVNKNTFTVGDVDIKLDETNTDANPDDEDAPARDTQNTYTNVYPGQTVVKDPMVTFEKDSRDCYVRMLVTVDYDKLVAAFPSTEENDCKYADLWNGKLFLLEKLVVDAEGTCTWNQEKWPVAGVTYDEEAGTATYEFRYAEKVVEPKAESKLPALFTSITFPADMTNDEIAALNEFEVNVVAHAMQAEGFETADNPMAAAWAAWDAADKDAPEAPEATVETTEVPDHS